MLGKRIKVSLSNDDIVWATKVGILRYEESRRKGLKDKHGLKKSGIPRVVHDMVGARGELAYCRAARGEWSGSVNTFKDPDVDPDIQVRTTMNHNYNLIVRPEDPTEHKYVLVTGIGRTSSSSAGWKAWTRRAITGNAPQSVGPRRGSFRRRGSSRVWSTT